MALSDDRIFEIAEAYGTLDSEYRRAEFARAIEAEVRKQDTALILQPVEQLTPERVKEIVRGAGYDQCGIPDTERAAFINGLRHGEHAHGIRGGQHGTESST